MLSGVLKLLEGIGRSTTQAIAEFGYLFALLLESFYWLIWGPRRKQGVSFNAIIKQMREIGVDAIPIVTLLAFGIGVMLAIQGIHSLKTFGAESQVVLGIALSVTREFGALITGIVVAGRSGSALAARIGTMVVNQEIDALRVIGISPARYLVAPPLIGLIVVLPMLTILANLAALTGGAVFSSAELGITLSAYVHDTFSILTVSDIMQGIYKALVFAVIITLVGASNGFSAKGGAEGVGKITTRSVVLSISGIILADMTFTYFLTRIEG